jgi:nucleoside-diphosphate-sugar epimerase
MRYIVTGGAGFIGSNLADTAAPSVLEFPPCGRSHLAQHHGVVIIDNLATGLHLPPGGHSIRAPVGEGPPPLERRERDPMRGLMATKNNRTVPKPEGN